jgi:hypothetical protein
VDQRVVYRAPPQTLAAHASRGRRAKEVVKVFSPELSPATIMGPFPAWFAMSTGPGAGCVIK